jgi:hypothetical protein
MNAVEYTRAVRRVALVSGLGALLALLAFVRLGFIPFTEFLPFAALAAAAVPVILFVRRNRPVCESCGGRMKITSGYPRIVYRCRECGAELDTRIYSD